MTIKETCKKYGWAKEGDIVVEWDDAKDTSVPFRRKPIHPFLKWLFWLPICVVIFYFCLLVVGKAMQWILEGLN